MSSVLLQEQEGGSSNVLRGLKVLYSWRHCSMSTLSFLEGVEGLSIQQFVSELPIETFTVSVLPGTAGFDVQGLYS